MLSTNVLCMKKRKKRSYYVSNVSDYGARKYLKKRTSHSSISMIQITEDTPPDMLAGAMDLMVHLPDGKATKMAVERSTPMMDVLVQITNTNHLQISGYVLQPLAIHNPHGYGEKILPYFPNTPIGTLDTQDIRVVAKNRGNFYQRTNAPSQPFESTFRLKVHLPRNQLYVERVSMQAYLHDIMKKMCEEKNLDRNKYEFRHPSNLDQILDLKLRLSDYQITEVYAISKGSSRLSQVFSSSDSFMAFRKDDDRRQKSGGGIFNFLKRGKVSNGSGSLSSDNRSISPTHSDDSRSVSPPVGGVKLTPSADKPKAPQRKRRPAPKPPSLTSLNPPADDKKTEDEVGAQMRQKEGLTICHSRNSSDSSGYHEASILSDNANTSLPRKRPQTISSTSNLTAMKPQSKSTSSLAFGSRLKKKAAPPPPPTVKSASSDAHLETASPVVASPTNEAATPGEDGKQCEALKYTNAPCALVATTGVSHVMDLSKEINTILSTGNEKMSANNSLNQSKIFVHQIPELLDEDNADEEGDCSPLKPILELDRSRSVDRLDEKNYEDMFNKLLKTSMNGSIFEDLDQIEQDELLLSLSKPSPKNKSEDTDQVDITFSSLSANSDDSNEDIAEVGPELLSLKPNYFPNPPIIKEPQSQINVTSEKNFSSLTAIERRYPHDSKPRVISVTFKEKSHSLRKYSSTGDISKCDIPTSPTSEDLLTTLYLCSNYALTTSVSADVDAKKHIEVSPPESLASSLSTTLSSNIETDIGNTIKDEITQESVDDSFVRENTVNNENNCKITVVPSEAPKPEIVTKPTAEVVTDVIKTQKVVENESDIISKEEDKPTNEDDTSDYSKNELILPTDWEYQLPSPPTAFRDSSPLLDTTTSEESETMSEIHPSTDSILTSPELFEKLHVIKETQSQISESEVLSAKSVDSEEEKFINKLSLENLEIRKKLVYNRELATSLKYQDQDADDVASKRSSVMSELEDVLKPSNGHTNGHSRITPTTLDTNKNWNKVRAAAGNFNAASRADRALPNFKITTYDIPKKKIHIFEDDSVRSNVALPVSNSVQTNEPEEVVEEEKPTFLSPSRPTGQEHNKNRCFTLNRQFLQRSESFNTWTPSVPVKRSKSQIALKQEVSEKPLLTSQFEEKQNKSKSTLDLTGLQSIEVMKAIRTSLTTTASSSTFSSAKPATTRDEDAYPAPAKETPTVANKPLIPIKQRPMSMFATPSINFAPWKERKPVVSVKTTSVPSQATKTPSITTLNDISLQTATPIPPKPPKTVSAPNNVSIKVNGSEPISQQATGNVLIKIGQPKSQDELTKRYINHSTAVGYRKPLGNINKVQNVRPHSIAIEKFEKIDQFDASRVPIVRAVELKKHAHPNGTSVTQIRPDGDANKVNLFEKVVLRSVAKRRPAERPASVNISSNNKPDQRNLLLESIRNFGGKKGLKTVKV